jgi:hypothetical protein
MKKFVLGVCFLVGSVLLCSANNGTGSEKFCARHCSEYVGSVTTTTIDPPGDTTTTTLPTCGNGQCPDSCAFSCVDEATGICNVNCATEQSLEARYNALLRHLTEVQITCAKHPYYHPCRVVTPTAKYPSGLKCPHPATPHRVLVPVRGTNG